MPKSVTSNSNSLTAADLVLEMLENILADPEMDLHAKLDQLHELSIGHTFFDSPQQVVTIISVLAEIIASDSNPEVRAASLGVMEQIIALEEKAELEQGKPTIDWRVVNVMLHAAKKQEKLDTEEAVLLSTQENAMLDVQKMALESSLKIKAVELQLETLKLDPVIKVIAKPGVVLSPTVTSERPRVQGVTPPILEKGAEPPIMKFLRSVADTDNEEHIRALASRIITKIENLTSLKPPSFAKPAPQQVD